MVGGLPTRDEHLKFAAADVARASGLLGSPAMGSSGTEIALLRIEAVLLELVERLGRLEARQGTNSKGPATPAPSPAATPAPSPGQSRGVESLSLRQLRARCDALGLTGCDRRSKASMREALRAAGEV